MVMLIYKWKKWTTDKEEKRNEKKKEQMKMEFNRSTSGAVVVILKRMDCLIITWALLQNKCTLQASLILS